MQIGKQYIEAKAKVMPDRFNKDALYALIERTAGKKYAEKFIFEKIDSDGFDSYEICQLNDKICIRANTGVAAAVGFNKYLKEICNYSIGALSISGTLPETPPDVDKVICGKSEFLYRYFFNFCTFSYTCAFDKWEDWEKTLDYLVLSGYNLILNPIAIETVWYNTLKELGYTNEAIKNFICGPAFYTWQWVCNLTGWAGGAPESWYKKRAELCEKYNKRLYELGAATVSVGYIGMVPDDFCDFYPDSAPLKQGLWCGLVRPAFILPGDPNFEKVADTYYRELRKIGGNENVCFFAGDPFHEGGNKEGVDIPRYALGCYEKMREYNKNAVWVIQEWGSPKMEIPDSVAAKYPNGVILLSLVADRRDTDPQEEQATPWIYAAVNAFGGQEVMQGAAKEELFNPRLHLKNKNSNIIGVGYIPESINANEILYHIFAENNFGKGYNSIDEYLRAYNKERYGKVFEDIIATQEKVFLTALHIDRILGGESGLCSRPSLDVCSVSAWANPARPYMDQTVLVDFVKAMYSHYDELKHMGGYKRDLLEAARQMLNNLSWFFIAELQDAYKKGNIEELSELGKEFLSLYELQSDLVSTDKAFLLGVWLEKAKNCGDTPAEEAYFEWNARHLITLWTNEAGSGNFGEDGLRDYSAREWNGMLEDFYKPRWERFISRLEISLLTGNALEPINNYHEELGFVYEKKCYTAEPYGCLKMAVCKIIECVETTKINYRSYDVNGMSFEEYIAKSFEESTNG